MAIRGGGSRRSGGHFGSSRSGGGSGSRLTSSFGGSRQRSVRTSVSNISFRSPIRRTIHVSSSPIIIGGGNENIAVPLIAKVLPVIFVAIFISICFLTIVLTGRGGASQNLKVIEQDYSFYYSMAQRAQNNSDYTTTAEITNIIKNPNGKKYCIEYEYTDVVFPKEMYSFYVYSLQDIQTLGYNIGDVIVVALDEKNFNSLTDSVPIDYLNTTLKDDEEYLQTKNKLTTYTAVLIIVSVLIVALTTLIIVKIVKNHKKKEAEQKQQEKTEQEEKNKVRVCAYCGSFAETGVLKCESCGAKEFEMK